MDISKNLKEEENRKNRPIIITDDKDKTVEYECKYCNCTIKAKLSEESIFCFHCQSEIYLIEGDIRKALKSVKAHNTIDDTEVFVATTPDPNEQYMKKEQELKGSFKALRDKGLKIKNYREHIPK